MYLDQNIDIILDYILACEMCGLSLNITTDEAPVMRSPVFVTAVKVDIVLKVNDRCELVLGGRQVCWGGERCAQQASKDCYLQGKSLAGQCQSYNNTSKSE